MQGIRRESDDGWAVSRDGPRLLRRVRGHGLRLRDSAEAMMTFVYALGGLFTLVVLIYLIVALLVPEKF
jgi:hypothetical protein